MPDKTFLKITNRDIYDKMEAFIEQNIEGHNTIIKHQVETNGKVKINTFLSRSALGLAVLALSIITGINLLL